MSRDGAEEPELKVDEDWKSTVQLDKEKLKRTEQGGAKESSGSPDGSTDASLTRDSIQEDEQGNQPPPPASFEFLVSGMATQAIAAMGHIPGDDGKPMPVRIDYARHYIDLLTIIETKTAGNLSDSEQRFLQNTLHQLRMLFVAIKK